MNKKLASATQMTLEHFPPEELAALNLAVEMGAVPSTNLCFDRAVEEKLLKPSGVAHDPETLKAALTFEVNRRGAEGRWL